MKKFSNLLLIAFASLLLASCLDETQWEKYEEWRADQDEWLKTQLARTDAQGDKYFETISASFDKNAVIYIHYHNDREATKNNLVPLYTSVVDVKYHGRLYNDVAFDSSYLSTSPADSVLRFSQSGLITGWVIALQNMHVGDSVTVIIPWNVGYGENGTSSIKPYSHLIFDMKLHDIYKYEAKP
ncbi:MAG: FKBP-type peptidyl-prolyl cis-trans isomerase [Muribaculaceae bacterium]